MIQVRSEFFVLLRKALNGIPYEDELDAEEWRSVFLLAQMQLLEGVIWPVVKNQKLPLDIAFQWVGIAERNRGLNELQNKEAARLTQVFEKTGRKLVILKGQANARLYPNKVSRHPGDIDIWVEGCRDSIIQLLIELGLLEERPTEANLGKKNKATVGYHHVNLPPAKNGVDVEVHFRPSSGIFCPWTNRRLQGWLEREVLSMTLVEEGFNVPSIRFALVMQLSHIHRHFLREGVGMRQICDYYLLLRNSTSEDRQEVSGVLGRFGLRRTAGALMWLLGETLCLDEGLMICEKDEWRGEWMLREIMEGGNFGHYAERLRTGVWRRFLSNKARNAKLMRFDFWEVVWMELLYMKMIVRTVPERMRRGSLSLRTT